MPTPPHAIRSNVNYSEMKAKTFRYQSLGSKRNKNVLICSQTFLIESRSFRFDPEIISRQGRSFLFGPKPLRSTKTFQKLSRPKQNVSLFIRKLVDESSHLYVTVPAACLVCCRLTNLSVCSLVYLSFNHVASVILSI